MEKLNREARVCDDAAAGLAEGMWHSFGAVRHVDAAETLVRDLYADSPIGIPFDVEVETRDASLPWVPRTWRFRVSFSDRTGFVTTPLRGE